MKSPLEFVRRHQVLVLAIGMPLVFGIVLFWLSRQPKVDPRVAAIRMKGDPTTLTELDAWYPAVPADQNAALTCQLAFTNQFFASEGNSADWLADRSLLTLLGEPLGDDTVKELETQLRQLSGVLDLLHSIPQHAPSRYALDLRQGFVVLLPHLGKMKRAVQLLGVEARVHSARGDVQKALESLEAAGRVTETLREEPLFISYLVRLAGWGITLNHLERLLSEQRLTDGQLEAVEALLAAANDEHGLRRALAGERAMGLAMFDDRMNQTAMFRGGAGSGNTGSSELWKTSLLVGLFKATGFFAKDRGFYLDALSNTIYAAEQPFPSRVQVMRQVTGVVPPNRLYIISRIILPALSSPYVKETDYLARVRSARAVVRVERYRNARDGALPSNLIEAAGSAPSFLDPYTGTPLLYRKLDHGYVIYSVGVDGRDDHGDGVGELERRNTSSGTKRTPTDVGFKVAR